jgi:pimeloyl-ACP methyl ester carboxylesterase
VGHSYGGWVALGTAAKAKGKDKDRIKSVISMDHVIQADDITKSAP